VAASGARGLTEVRAAGHARALYRVYPEGATTPDVSYSRGDRILARFAGDRLHRVDVAGSADGAYLEVPRRVP
jgi:hypothetical protein